MSILVLADHDLGLLSPATARVVNAALQLGSDVHVLVAGHDVGAIASSAATIAGVAKVLVADSADLSSQSAEVLADLLAPLMATYSHVVTASTAVGRDVIPRLAALSDLMPITDVIAIHAPNRFDRPVYAGNAIETLRSEQSVNLLTIRASAFARQALDAAPAPVAALPAGAHKNLVTHLQELRTDSDTPDLSTARIVVSGGISLGSAESFKMIGKLAETLGAAVGATRAAVDAGYAPNDWQVGQTGKVVAPDLYIGIGISGALQHLAGIQGAKKIIAINKDPEAPLMKIADFSLTGDLFEIVPELIAQLSKN